MVNFYCKSKTVETIFWGNKGGAGGKEGEPKAVVEQQRSVKRLSTSLNTHLKHMCFERHKHTKPQQQQQNVILSGKDRSLLLRERQRE